MNKLGRKGLSDCHVSNDAFRKGYERTFSARVEYPAEAMVAYLNCICHCGEIGRVSSMDEAYRQGWKFHHEEWNCPACGEAQ